MFLCHKHDFTKLNTRLLYNIEHWTEYLCSLTLVAFFCILQELFWAISHCTLATSLPCNALNLRLSSSCISTPLVEKLRSNVNAITFLNFLIKIFWSSAFSKFSFFVTFHYLIELNSNMIDRIEIRTKCDE